MTPQLSPLPESPRRPDIVAMALMQPNATKTGHRSLKGEQKSQGCNPVSDKSLQ